MIKKIFKIVIIGIVIGILTYPFYCWYGYGVNIFLHGFIQKDNYTYHYEHGIMNKGLRNIDGNYYYFDEDGHMFQDEILYLNDKYYYFDLDGKMQEGNIVYKGFNIVLENGQFKKDIDYLKNGLNKIIEENKEATISIYYKDLESRNSFIINDMPMYPCSIIKIGVMVETFEKIALGNLTYEDCYPYLWAMITYSDNTSYNYLLRLIGDGDGLTGAMITNEYLESLGLTDTKIHHGLLEGEYYFTDGNSNTSSAKDIGLLLELINDGKVVNQESCQQMKDLLLACLDDTALASGMSLDVEFAHKSGWAYEYYHDGGIVNDDYIIVVFSDGALDYQKLMGKIAKFLYNYELDFEQFLNKKYIK